MGPLRFEEEFSYANNPRAARPALGTNFGVSGSGGRAVSHYALMTNAIYDFTVGWPVTPHIGVGIGAVNLHNSASLGRVTRTCWDSVRRQAARSCRTANGSSAIRGIAGIGTASTGLAFDLDYRYLATTDPTFKTVSGGTISGSYATHNIWRA
jgi:opacity protein-like surface antigen